MSINSLIKPVLLVLSLSTPLLPAVFGGPDGPVRYVGQDGTSNSDYSNGYHDGQMRPAIGVQNYQILRANRTHPEWSDGLGWTYNHAPMLAYAHGRFYCQYLTNPTGEHIPPGVTMLARSRDGKHWTRPQVLFPIYYTARDADSFQFTYMHQRMGFYLAPNGRFLTMAFYGGNDGHGVGRVVREIDEDDSLGPVYFIRVNDNWKGQVHYPLVTESGDPRFIEACQAFLADPIRRMQWWEEDRFARDKDTFYRVPWITRRGRNEPGKAFSFFTRPDDAVVGFFKGRWATLTTDGGETWSQPVYCESLTYGGAKIWAQALDNGQFALVYNPTDSAARHPLSVATSDDGIHFDGLANVHGEVPVKRFWGREKRPGPQYVRGIVEGNGNPPGSDLWVVYSVNKEDIWISRVPVPIKREWTGPVRDDFNCMETGGVITGWNVYSPQWCPVEVVEFPGSTEKSMRLQDFDPYDYAKAVRVFEPTDEVTLSFDLMVESSAQILAIEVVSVKGKRVIQAQIDTDGAFAVRDGDDPLRTASRFETDRWYALELVLNTPARRFALRIDGKTLLEDVAYSVPEGRPERMVLRTGPYRLADDVQKYKSGSESKPGWDEPGTDERVLAAVYYIKSFQAVKAFQAVPSVHSLLEPAAFGRHIERFNAMEDENVTNFVSNAASWDWLRDNIPFFECPDTEVEEIYYFRWWSFRKHLKQTPKGFVFTEFLTPVGHAGEFNTISCAAGHHIAEGRWLRDGMYIDDYIQFWLRGHDGQPQPHFHKFSSWFAAAVYERYLVNNDRTFLVGLLEDLVTDYRTWEQERMLPNGIFWQYDVRDGMEESISGARRKKQVRPTINSYMYANARAIRKIAKLAARPELMREFDHKTKTLRSLTLDKLWYPEAEFFEVRHPENGFSNVREAIGFIPWAFHLPEQGKGCEVAWAQLTDPNGFDAPYGITTAERHHPKFRSHGIGTCEWDGAVWPFATSQTLSALANVLHDYPQQTISRPVYFSSFLTYVRSQHADGKPYIGEYLDEVTGDWINRGDRSRYYNHSTFADLLITGVVGLCPRADDIVEVYPLLPDGTWDWFCLEGVKYHGRTLTIAWDRDGSRYGRGAGLRVLADGKVIAQSGHLERITGKLP